MSDNPFGLLVDDDTQATNKAESQQRLTAPQRSFNSSPNIADDAKGFMTNPANILSGLVGLAIGASAADRGANGFNSALQGIVGGLGARGGIEQSFTQDRNVERTQLLQEQQAIDGAEQDRLQSQYQLGAQEAARANAAYTYASYMGNMAFEQRRLEMLAEQQAREHDMLMQQGALANQQVNDPYASIMDEATWNKAIGPITGFDPMDTPEARTIKYLRYRSQMMDVIDGRARLGTRPDGSWDVLYPSLVETPPGGAPQDDMNTPAPDNKPVEEEVPPPPRASVRDQRTGDKKPVYKNDPILPQRGGNVPPARGRSSENTGFNGKSVAELETWRKNNMLSADAETKKAWQKEYAAAKARQRRGKE